MYPADKEAKQLILSIGKKMVQGGYVTANDGNITIRVAKDAIWATPTGINKGDLTEEMLIKIEISTGRVIEGTWKPTSELEMHLNVYRTDDEIVSTAHAHPLNLSVLACAGLELDLPTTPAACCISGRVPVVPYECSGSKALAESVIPYVKEYNLVNLGNHGPIAWGRAPMEAWYRLEDAEASAKLALKLAQLGRLRPLTVSQLEELYCFHHVRISDAARVRRVEESADHDAAIPFTEFFKDIVSL